MTKIFDPKQQLHDLALSQAQGVRQRALLEMLLNFGEIPYTILTKSHGTRLYPVAMYGEKQHRIEVSGPLRPLTKRLAAVGFMLKIDRNRHTIRLVWRGKRHG